MALPRVEHCTIIAEHVMRASAAHVFSALGDATLRQHWDKPGDGWEVAERVQDFWPGGRESTRFGPAGNPLYTSEARYLDIVANQRIVTAGAILEGERAVSMTLCTIELIPADIGTRVRVTDQSVFTGGSELPEDRRAGWEAILRQLDSWLAWHPRTRTGEPAEAALV